MKLILNKTYHIVIVLGCIFFTVSSVFLYMKVQERNAYMKGLINTSLSGKKLLTRDDTVSVLSKSIYMLTSNDHGVELDKMDWYERFESTFLFNMSSTVALKYGGYGVHGHYVFGPCGTMSRTLLNVLWDLNIPARKLQLLNNSQGKGGGHTMVEYLDKGKWKVIAPSDRTLIWRNAKNEIADVHEIQSDKAIFNQVYVNHPNFPYLFDNPKHINWSKLPVWLQNLTNSVIGDELYNTMETPSWYDQPRHTMFIVSSTVLLFFCMMFLTIHKKKLFFKLMSIFNQQLNTLTMKKLQTKKMSMPVHNV